MVPIRCICNPCLTEFARRVDSIADDQPTHIEIRLICRHNGVGLVAWCVERAVQTWILLPATNSEELRLIADLALTNQVDRAALAPRPQSVVIGQAAGTLRFSGAATGVTGVTGDNQERGSASDDTDSRT
jgi:hypothetical protein